MNRRVAAVPLKFLRILRVLRAAELANKRFVAAVKERLNPATRTLFTNLTWLAYTWHVIACLYLRVASTPGSSAWAPPDYLTNSSSTCASLGL